MRMKLRFPQGDMHSSSEDKTIQLSTTWLQNLNSRHKDVPIASQTSFGLTPGQNEYTIKSDRMDKR